MSTTEGNKLIAEFMGAKYIPKYGFADQMGYEFKSEPQHTKDKWGEGNATWWGEDHLEYHENWRWLMAVVEKISEYHYPNYFTGCPESHEREPYEDCAYLRTFGMRDIEGNYMVRFNADVLVKGKTLIEATWLAVIDHITWYNTQSKALPQPPIK